MDADRSRGLRAGRVPAGVVDVPGWIGRGRELDEREIGVGARGAQCCGVLVVGEIAARRLAQTVARGRLIVPVDDHRPRFARARNAMRGRQEIIAVIARHVRDQRAGADVGRVIVVGVREDHVVDEVARVIQIDVANDGVGRFGAATIDHVKEVAGGVVAVANHDCVSGALPHG